MVSPFVAEIRIFGFNFPPTGWALCNGQLLPISQNTALFSLVGTFYGGDGKSTFALPDLQGSVAVHQGQGQGLQTWDLGQSEGSETVTLVESEIPAHNHALMATMTNGNGQQGTGGQLARAFKGNLQSSNRAKMYSTAAPNVQLREEALSLTGGSQPHNNMMPYMALNFCIALQGVFPQRG